MQLLNINKPLLLEQTSKHSELFGQLLGGRGFDGLSHNQSYFIKRNYQEDVVLGGYGVFGWRQSDW